MIMKKHTFILLIFIFLFCSCTKEQYQGYHLAEEHHEKLKDHHNNYHVKETHRVLKKNAETKEERAEDAEDKRLAKNKHLIETAKKIKKPKKKQLDFDLY